MEGGNSGQPLDPTWSISRSGDPVSIVNGQLGIHNATQPSSAVIRLDVPNTHNNANIKFFWFTFDFSGNTPALDFDTNDPGSLLVPEPASFSMIALGGLGTWLARRKQQRKFRRKKKETKFEELDFALPFLAEEVSTSAFGGCRERLAFHLK